MFKRHSASKSNTTQESTTTPNSKTATQFAKHYDDSSDEEETPQRVKQYRIDQHCQNFFSSSRNHGPATLKNDDLLSFVAHAAGIKLLYHDDINTHYYKLKEKHLAPTTTSTTAPQQLQTLIHDALFSTIKQMKAPLSHFMMIQFNRSKTEQIIEEMEIAAQEALRLSFDELFITHQNLFILLLKEPNSHLSKQSNHAAFIATVTTLIATPLLCHYTPAKKSVALKEIMQSFEQLAVEKLWDLVEQLSIRKLINADGRQQAIASLEKSLDPYQALRKFMITILNDQPANGYIETTFQKIIAREGYQQRLCHAYMNDLIQIHHMKATRCYLNSTEQKNFSRYTASHHDNILAEIQRHLPETLAKEIAAGIRALHRPTLGKHHVFASQNAYHFYANLRLANRSQQRQIRNLQHAIQQQDSVARIWQLTADSLGECDVVETQHITGTHLGRKDLVEGLGSYDKVYELIKQIKNYGTQKAMCISDETIAQWLRSIFQGNTPTLSGRKMDILVLQHKLQSLVYLLFGCEVTRNPAMGVINHMLLDLILAKQMTFAEAFVGSDAADNCLNQPRLMPMSPKGAVAVARALHTSYKDVMPYPYQYPGVVDNEQRSATFNREDMIKYEAQIVRSWISHTTTVPKRLSLPELATWCLNLIESQFKRWFETSEPLQNTDYLTTATQQLTR